MNDIDLSTFPSNKFEALTMLYLRNQDLTGFTPEELRDKYYEVYSKIRNHNKDASNTYRQKRFSN